MAGRRIADGAVEAAAVADLLGLDRFATWGFSGEGGYALACAALRSDRVTAAVVMATIAPYEALGDAWAAHWGADRQAEVRRFFDDPAQARVNFEAEADDYCPALSSAEGWRSRWGDRAGTDDAHSGEVAEHLARQCGEALKIGDEGWWEDHVAYLTPWGFDLGDISMPVELWHGVDERAAGAAHGRWLAEHIPGVDPHLVQGEDHTNGETLHQADAWDWITAGIQRR
jgi:pimeloyl-ACP methyl ester carboxylesterase